MKICIVGLGYVGLTLAGRCLEVGHEVLGVEINKATRDTISSGKAHFHEPGLNEIISRAVSSKLLDVVAPSSIENCSNTFDVIVITVGTPLKNGSNTPNLGYISDSLRSISSLVSESNLLVLRSTVTVGLTRTSVIPLLESYTGIQSANLNVAFCPERTLEGDALNELASLPQVVSGNRKKAEDLAQQFFKTLCPSVLLAENLESAELVKLFNNVYRDINFSIGNLFNNVAMYFGIDGIEAINLANKDYPRSTIARPGLVGGPCLEKDSYILCSNIDDIGISSVVLEARKYNESLESNIVTWALENSSSRILICGMAFKGKPGTNDLRGSNSVSIARKLHAYGRQVDMYDPICSVNELSQLGFGNVVNNINSLNVGFGDCVIVLNNNEFFETSEFAKAVSVGRVLDVWNVVQLKNKLTLGNYKL